MTNAPVDQNNIQGDLWPRLPKKAERFIFFRITNVEEFKKALPIMADYITTAYTTGKNREEILKKKSQGDNSLIKLVSMNIAFSASGLAKLGAEKFNDEIFNGGQFKDMTYPEPGESAADHQGLDHQHEWLPAFKPSNGLLDGCITVTGESKESIEKLCKKTIDWVFNVGNDKQSIETVYTKDGIVHPGHIEHFGWADGISQPLVKGLDDLSTAKNSNGMKPVDAGRFIIGHEGDNSNSPAWAKDGSFMVFRIYEQLVPEFFHWCARNCSIAAADTQECLQQGKPVQWSDKAMDQLALFSSRLVGRWPDGAPMELHPQTDPNWKVNRAKYEGKLEAINTTDDFNYNPRDQTKCPYASHMRKTGPRNDYAEYAKHVMLRRGIPYGDLCGNEERSGGFTLQERGLLFVSYQSSIEDGFVTQQKRWANADNTPTDMAQHCGGASQGIDPLIGQVAPTRNGKPKDGKFNATYVDAPRIPFPETDLEKPATQDFDGGKLDLDRLVIPRGGEYFFSPSISALKDYLPNA